MNRATIIIPTRNRETLVAAAIESCLAQRVAGVQIVVVDDASEDATLARLGELGDRVETVALPKRVGQCNARNAGLCRAAGPFVKFLDSDDVLEPGSLAEELRTADESEADIVLSGWGVCRLGPEGRIEEDSEQRYEPPIMEPLLDRLLRGDAVPLTAALYRRSYIAGLEWDQEISKLDDWDWFCRAVLRMGRVVSRSGVSFWWRHHGGSRVSTEASLRENAVSHHRILHRIEEALEAMGELTPERRKQLVRYYYKELRVLSLHEPQTCELAIRHMEELWPAFAPGDEEQRGLVRAAARLLGLRRTLRLYGAWKRLRGPVSEGVSRVS